MHASIYFVFIKNSQNTNKKNGGLTRDYLLKHLARREQVKKYLYIKDDIKVVFRPNVARKWKSFYNNQ